MSRFALTVILIAFLQIFSLAQDVTSDSQLALQYFKDKEFDKAAQLYQKLYSQTSVRVYFQYYIQCLTELKQFEDAEKIIKKEIKANKSETINYIELGYVYKLQNKLKDAEEMYLTAIYETRPDQSNYVNLANTFISRREYDYAEKTYQEARKVIKTGYGFQFELAYVYQLKGKFDAMINEYMNLLETNENFLQSVQNRLQATVYDNLSNDLTDVLKKNLLLRVQKRPDKTIFVEMLIWLYLQESDFENALIQAKALDKRLSESGKRVYEIGGLANDAFEFDIASQAYLYVINLGELNAYYMDARSEYLQVMYNKVLKQKPSQTDLINLEKQFSDAIIDLGINKSTFSIIQKLAYIQAFLLNESAKARDLVDKVINSGKISPTQVAEAKILLGDIYLFDKEIWEATLIYAQVEKMYPNDVLGHDAKLKKARLAYFSGDFKWASAQLSVLKAATTKLIANDAFGMAMLIKDNLVDDPDGNALQIMSRAEWLHYRRQDSLAILTLDSIIEKFSLNTIIDDAYYLKAKYLEGMSQYDKAIEMYDKVATVYPLDILADDALFDMALLYQNIMKLPEKARDTYKRIVLDHPGSIYISEARKVYRELKVKYPEAIN